MVNIWQKKHGCTKRMNLEMEPKYLTKTEVQLNANTLKTKNNKSTVKSTRIMNVYWF